MTQQEFTDRTGYTPTSNEYIDIEQEYYDSPLQKDEFCKQWKEENKGRIADQRRKNERAAKLEKAYRVEEKLAWKVSKIFRYAEIGLTAAKDIITFDIAQRDIRKFGGQPRYNRVLNEFVVYAANVLDIEY